MAFEFVSAVADGKWAEASKVLDAAIQAAEARAEADERQTLAQLLVNRGYCQQKLQLYRKALKDYDSALEKCQNFPLALYRKGQVLSAQKKAEEARKAWNAALQACDESSDVQLVLDIHAALRDPSAMKEALAPSGSVQQHYGGGKASAALLGCLQVVTVVLLGLLLAGQYQHHLLHQQVGLNAVVGPATPDQGVPPAPKLSDGGANGWGVHTPPQHPPASTTGSGSLPTSAAAAGSPQGQEQASYAGTSGGARAVHPPQPSSSHLGEPPSNRGGVASTSAAATAASAAGRPAPAAKGGSPAGTGAGSSGGLKPAKPGGADGACDVEEVDCVAAQQQRQRSGAAAGPGPGAGAPADVQTVLNNSLAIQLAVTQINSGLVAEAESVLDGVIASVPRELGARVSRGTARALRRNLQGAVEDFSVAIEVEPRYADSWKRRGQARSALGDTEGALADLQKAIDLAPLFGGPDSSSNRAECYVERGMIYQKQRDYRRACRELQQAVKLDPSNAQAWNVLGLCSTSQGDIRDGVHAYEKAVELNPKLKEGWVNMGQALKEEGRTKEAERALTRALGLDPPDAPSVHVLRILAQMKQQKGEHAGAVRLLDKALPVAQAKEEQVIELLYLRAICYHALGAVREAVRDYDDCLSTLPRGGLANATEEARQFQFLSFYQKDMALYLYRSLDRRAADFCLDSELPPVFKELWCKKGPPTAELVAHFPPQAPLPLSPAPLGPPPDWEVLRPLTELADQLGVLLQNHHQGFLPNARQQRAAGYAAVELGQAVLEVVEARRAGRQQWVRSEGSSGQAGGAGRHLFGWRDAMDIVVKWRQLAEPADQVVWVDLLTRREFEQGFGSHTPMFSGQTKCVRYYMNFHRALELQRQVLLREGHAFDASNATIPVGSEAQKEAIRAARTAEDMYKVIRNDSWVVVPIHSVARPDVMLEGTRLTLVRVPNQPDSYEFSIRTPVTPPRWKDFDSELEAAFEGILQALEAGDQPLLARRIMVFCYYWYNFMPLARGTAAVGYTTMLGLLWAADMPATAPIPKDYQVDWEAILSQHPDDFAASVGVWLYPPQARGPATEEQLAAHNAAVAKPFTPMSQLPRVSEVLGTIRQRLAALNGEGAKRYV